MASYKIQKANGAAPADETELAVAQALVDLETSIPELRALAISSAKEVNATFLIHIVLNEMINYKCSQVELGAGKKALVIFVPVPQLKGFNKIQQK